MTLELSECQAIHCTEKPQHRVAFETPGAVDGELELCSIHTWRVFDAAPRDGVVEVVAP